MPTLIIEEEKELPKAKIVDSIPSDVPPNEEEEKPKRQRKTTGQRKTRTKKPKDKYDVLYNKLFKIVALPAGVLMIQGLASGNAVLAADGQLLGEHAESITLKLVEIAKQYEWFYKLLENVTSVASIGANPVIALAVECIVIGIGIAHNHGKDINVPGISFFTQ